jgi:hypothetical protein
VTLGIALATARRDAHREQAFLSRMPQSERDGGFCKARGRFVSHSTSAQLFIAVRD